MRNLTQVEGMSIDALRAGIDWSFETFGEYLAQLRERGSVANVAAYVGHSSVRTYVMGADAAHREATAGEIAQMQAIVRDAMANGAVGFASSTSPAHNGEGGTADAVPAGQRCGDGGARRRDGRQRARRLHADEGLATSSSSRSSSRWPRRPAGP